MPTSNNRWNFPPLNGGVEFIADPSSAYFDDNPISKLVRELIQNSLDARKTGISEPVYVTFAEATVHRSLIGADELQIHLKSCLDRAIKENRSESIRNIYRRAVETIEKPNIRCLKISDTNTTGLHDNRWDALVTQEGSVQKSDSGAPGGNYGIGKNAVLNVSDLRTVFYSTHYVNGGKGRVDKLQGKATLMAHPASDDPSQLLQHVGFYTEEDGKPITAYRNIDQFFRLKQQGAGVYILGFNPRVNNWVESVVLAVLRNYFYAIHHRKLVVNIETDKHTGETITHEDLELLFDRFGKKIQESFSYYRAISDTEVTKTKDIPIIGPLDLYIKIDDGPRRMAYINRNGMLITDSREKKDNPIPPNSRSLWPDFAVVIMPSTDCGDKKIRDMEPPSHDAILVSKLDSESEQKHMTEAFSRARKIIQEIMDKKTHLAQSGNQANLRELAEMFPELNPETEGITEVVTREIPLRTTEQSQFVNLNDANNPDDDGDIVDSDNTGEYGGARDGNQRGTNNTSDQPGNQGKVQRKGNYDSKRNRVSIRNVRVISKDANTVIIAIDPTEDRQKVKFALRAAGEELQSFDLINIVSANLVKPQKKQRTEVVNNVIELISDNADRARAVIEIKTENSIENFAFKMEVKN